MEINIDNFLKETEAFLEQEQERAKRGGNKEGSNYPIVYPGVPGGSLTIKLLWNMKSGTVIRQIQRHGGFGDKGRQKIPCLSKYGIECPICNKIKEIEDKLGESCGVKNKYSAKTQSIAYAQLIDYNDSYKEMPEKGSIILFMFPYTIYKQIMTQLNQFGQDSKNLISTNSGKPFIINTALAQGPNMYSVTVHPFNTIQSFETDEEYFKCLNDLPDLMDTLVPKDVNEDLMNRVNAAVDTLNGEYYGMQSDMPTKTETVPNQQVTIGSPVQQTQNTIPVQQVVQNQVNEQASAQAVQTTTTVAQQVQPQVTLEQKIEEQANSNKPACYGQYSMTEKKCLICPYGTDCADIS